VISTLPIRTENSFVSLLPCLKIVKITNLTQIIEKLDIKDEVKAVKYLLLNNLYR